MKRLVLAAALSMAGCGPALDANGSPIPPGSVSDACAEDLADWTDVLFELDSRLNVGMNFQAYSEKVADARVAYDRLKFSEMDADCIIGAAQPSEKAMNAYIRAYTTWNDCIGETDCDNDSIKPELQAEWSTATALLAEVKKRLP